MTGKGLGYYLNLLFNPFSGLQGLPTDKQLEEFEQKLQEKRDSIDGILAELQQKVNLSEYNIEMFRNDQGSVLGTQPQSGYGAYIKLGKKSVLTLDFNIGSPNHPLAYVSSDKDPKYTNLAHRVAAQLEKQNVNIHSIKTYN